VPYWTDDNYAITINGKPYQCDIKPSDYVIINRIWKNDDVIKINLPMSLHACPMPDDASLVAVMFGHFVLAGKLGGADLNINNVHTRKSWYEFKNCPTVPPIFGDPANPGDWILQKDAKHLVFSTTGQGNNYTLSPLYNLFDERYVVYWRIYKRDSPKHREWLQHEKQKQQRLTSAVDMVKIGDNESETIHEFNGENTGIGHAYGHTWRHATDGAFFSYSLACLPDQEMKLVCTYWGGDSGNRVFDISIDKKIIATQSLQGEFPDRFFDIEYKIPFELTKGKRKISVEFRAKPGSTAGGLYGILVLGENQINE